MSQTVGLTTSSFDIREMGIKFLKYGVDFLALVKVDLV